jgi:signal transduction histidine kinase
MGIVQSFQNRSLGFKLNSLLFLIFGLLIVNVVTTTNSNIGNLFTELGDQRIADEDLLLSVELAGFEQDIIRDAQLLAASPAAIDAAASGTQTDVELPVLSNFDIYRNTAVQIFDADGEVVFTRVSPGVQYNGSAIDGIVRRALIGSDWTDFIIEDISGERRAFLVGAVPVVDAQSINVGAVVVSQPINADFLSSLGSERQNVEFFVIFEGRVVAFNADEVLPENFVNSPGVQQALSGQTSVEKESVSFGNQEIGQLAYFPLAVNNHVRAVIATLLDYGDLAIARQQIVTASILGITIPGVVAVSLVFGFVLFIVARPLSRLQAVTATMAKGNLEIRTETASKDEIGQLARSFNTMADQVVTQMAILEDQLIETEEARSQAVRSDQVKSAFLASMSHELRTPLNAVINFTRFVMDGDTGPVNEEQVDLLSQVVGSAKHLLNLINDVLDMSKIEAGSLNLFIEDEIDLNEVLKNVVKTGQGLVVGKPIRLQAEVEAALPPIRGDRQRITQILLNIISNACKFTEEGEITVRAYQENDQIVISVADTGPGIAPEDQTMVFEAFKQTQTGLRQGGGTGLGMPIARSLAEAHGGRLWLESEFGKGTNFFVALPLKSEILEPMMA